MLQRPAPAENAQKFQRIMQIPRNSPTQSANHTKFTPFVNVLDIMFQAPAQAENPQKFQRITQIPRNSSTQSCKDLFPQIMQDAVCIVCWFSRSFVSEACACFWGIFVRGFARRDLC